MQTDSHQNEGEIYPRNPYSRGPAAFGVMVGMITAIGLWIAYLQTAWSLGNVAAMLLILTTSALVGFLVARFGQSRRKRIVAARQQVQRDEREALTQRQLEEAREKGVI